MVVFSKEMLCEAKLRDLSSVMSYEIGKFDSTVCINCLRHEHTEQLTAHLLIGGFSLLFIQYIQVDSPSPTPTPTSFSFACGKGVFAEESLGF